MIIYDLQCKVGHQFEGWFPSAKAFEKQKQDGLLTCSLCGSEHVKRLPAGGHLASTKTKPKAPSLPKAPVDSPPESCDIPTTNLDPIVLMKAVHHYIKENCQDVGSEFTEKAMQMNRGEIPKQNICGSANEDQLDKLEDEGIDFSLIPKLPDEFEQ